MLAYRMPSLGADMESGFLREWHVKPGDPIKKGDIIADVETQKGIIEIEVFEEGTIGELLVAVDEKVPVGTLMATIIPPGEAQPAAPSPAREEEALPFPASSPLPVTDRQPIPATAALATDGHRVKGHPIRISPLARRIAAERGLDIYQLQGSGPEGAITRDDVEHALAAQPSPAAAPQKALQEAPQAVPQPDTQTTTAAAAVPPAPEAASPPARPLVPAPAPPSPTGASAESIRLAVAAAMSKSNREVPHYYLETKIDMSRALAWLAEANRQRPVKERLLPAALLIKAVAKALAEVPDLNASWEGGLQRKTSINIGYVVALRSGGIIVPTLHDADTKTPDELMQALNDLIPRGRALRLRSSELADSTLTVTSLGEGGVETVYGVIYPPQVALVGFGGISEQPWAEKGMLGIRPILVATLAADHRASDGSTGSRFLNAIKNYLQQPETLAT
jgi:pyruvate dehydrogenase E2 component (dihydrolipoamide acetyltransferase)